jgi:NDP-sugar pyrophosphorylase family protein
LHAQINSTDSLTEKIPVLLLVGGLGTRLRSVLPDKPKPLARIGEISFLELLLLQLRAQGMRRIVMCTGYGSAQIQQEFGNGGRWQLEISYSEETEPLGTAGAIKLAEPLAGTGPEFVVMNGDSFLELDFAKLLQSHREHAAFATIAVRNVANAARYGIIHVDSSWRVVQFSEKRGLAEPGLINGGVYVFSRRVFGRVPAGPSSLEKDILPALLADGVFAVEQTGMFIDIGTPDDYARAQTLYQKLSQAALQQACVGVTDPGNPREGSPRT